MADFAWEALLLEALGIDDPDHADGPSDLLPIVRWAVEDARCFEQALNQIRSVVESVDSDVWIEGEDENHPLWRALDRIDAIVMGVGPEVRRAFRRAAAGDRCRPEIGYHSTPHRGCVLR